MATLSQRAQLLKPSPTLAVSTKSKEMKAQGIDVVSFGAGQPDFDTPDHIKQEAKDALDRGETKYALPASGTAKFKDAVVRKFKNDNNLDYSAKNIFVSYGGKTCLYLAFQVLVDPGDEVMIPAPCWVSYPAQVEQAGGKPVIVRTDEKNNFKLTPDLLEKNITGKTKVLVLNSPCNPGGFTYTGDELKGLADVLADKDITVFSDEMYDRLVYCGTKFTSFAATHSDMFDKTLTFNACSKTFAMTGWRIGYIGGPEDIIGALGKLASQGTSAPAEFIQSAATVALTGDQQCVENMRKEFEKRGQHMWKRLNEIKGIECIEPTGAFYCFPNVSGWFGKELGGMKISGSMDFADVVLEKAHVAVVPGSGFSADNNVRTSFATSMEQIDKGLDRLADFLGTK